MTFHLVTGEWPPTSGGVGDYTEQLASALTAQGCRVHVWTGGQTRVRPPGGEVHALPDEFGAQAVDALARGVSDDPGVLLLQYVPNALGRRGLNVPFCFALLNLRRNGVDVRVMFHEPFFYFTLTRPLRNVLAVAHRAMAAILLRASTITYVSTEAWRRLLAPYGAQAASARILPIPSTVPVVADRAAVDRWRSVAAAGDPAVRVVGHFGTFGDHMATEVAAVIPELLGAAPSAVFLCIGRRSATFVADFVSRHTAYAGRVKSTGEVDRAQLSAALQACDLLVQPYPDGVTTRRTSVMAGLAHGIATVTTSGALTERVWAETGALALAPAGDPGATAREAVRLLGDDVRRVALGKRGRTVYDERFSMACTIRTLLDATPRSSPAPVAQAFRPASGPRATDHGPRA